MKTLVRLARTLIAPLALVATLAGCVSHPRFDPPTLPAARETVAQTASNAVCDANTVAQANAVSNIYANLQWAFLVSFLIVVAGGALAFWVERRLGAMIMAIGLFGLALASAAVFFLKALAWTGIVVILASLAVAVAYGIHYLVRLNKDHVELKAGIPTIVDQVKTLWDTHDDGN